MSASPKYQREIEGGGGGGVVGGKQNERERGGRETEKEGVRETGDTFRQVGGG